MACAVVPTGFAAREMLAVTTDQVNISASVFVCDFQIPRHRGGDAFDPGAELYCFLVCEARVVGVDNCGNEMLAD